MKLSPEAKDALIVSLIVVLLCTILPTGAVLMGHWLRWLDKALP